VASMASQAIAMLVQEIRGNDPDTPMGLPMVLDNQSCIAMGVSFRDTKHTRHILRRFHFVRWMVVEGRIILVWAPGVVNLADPATKNTSSSSPTFILQLAMLETTVKL
jgi:hypothetical protein